ncbi:MAG: hypothetical protein U0326_00820 [Polyangiales bacterium]
MTRFNVLLSAALFTVAGCGAGVDEGASTATSEVRCDAEHARNNPQVAPPQSRPHGRSYGEWEVAWWRWALGVAAERNPVTDETGANCAQGQSGDVWFLAGNYGGVTRRECTVPVGKALYFPMVNQVWVQMLTDPPSTVPEMYSYVRGAVAGATLSASIDGRALVDLTQYYEETAVFAAYFNPSNTWGATEAQCASRGRFLVCPESVDAGYALFIAPLSRGDHQIRFAATLNTGFSLDVTYTLHVR